MNLADLIIIVVLVVSVVSAFVKGFFVEAFSLAGVILGLFVAAANYAGFAPWVLRVVHNHQVANLIAFLVIAFLVMVVAGLAGRLLRGLVRGVGLGFVDRLFGAAFGLVKGCIVVTLILMGVVAFLPRQDWLMSFPVGPSVSKRGPRRLTCCTVCPGRRDTSGAGSATDYVSDTNINPAFERVGNRKRFL